MNDSKERSNIISVDAHTQIIIDTPVQGKQKFVYLHETPPIENLVFSGGGAKGVILPGVILALEEEQVREQIKNVAGSSIGAVTAALFAAGMSGKDFEDMAKSEDYKALLHSDPKQPFLNKDGKPLLDYIKKNIGKNIREHFKNIKNKYPSGLTDAEKIIINSLEGLKPGEPLPPITFKMLAVLHKLDPKNFKDLSITAVCVETGKLMIFNAETTPDLEVAVACRASASVPLVLEPVKIPAKLIKNLPDSVSQEDTLTFIDGGYLNNIPVSTVDAKQTKKQDHNESLQGQNLQTLVLVFDEISPQNNQSAYLNVDPSKSELYTASAIERQYRDNLPKVHLDIKTTEKNTVQKAKQLKMVRDEFTQRNIPLRVDGVTTLGFDAAKKNAVKLIASGKEVTKDYIKNHRGESLYYNFDRLDDLLLFMPIEQLENLINKNLKNIAPEHLKIIILLKKFIDNEINKNNVNQPQILQAFQHLLNDPTSIQSVDKTSLLNFIAMKLHRASGPKLAIKFLRDNKSSINNPITDYEKLYELKLCIEKIKKYQQDTIAGDMIFNQTRFKVIDLLINEAFNSSMPMLNSSQIENIYVQMAKLPLHIGVKLNLPDELYTLLKDFKQKINTYQKESNNLTDNEYILLELCTKHKDAFSISNRKSYQMIKDHNITLTEIKDFILKYPEHTETFFTQRTGTWLVGKNFREEFAQDSKLIVELLESKNTTIIKALLKSKLLETSHLSNTNKQLLNTTLNTVVPKSKPVTPAITNTPNEQTLDTATSKSSTRTLGK